LTDETIPVGAVLLFLALQIPCGIAVVNDTFEDLDEDLSCIEKADTPAEIEACNE
jgi:hypothetical protein